MKRSNFIFTVFLLLLQVGCAFAAAQEIFNAADFFQAVEENELAEVSRQLTLPGADVNAVIDEQTALMVAVLNDDADLVSWLLEQEGIDMDAMDAAGYTALMNAAMKGHETIVNLLLAAGANTEGAEQLAERHPAILQSIREHNPSVKSAAKR